MTVPDVHGPIDFVIIEFPAGTRGTETAAALVDLLDRATVRLYDLMAVRKEADGSYAELDLSTGSGELSDLGRLTGARSGLLGDDDMAEAAAALEPNTVAVVLLYENAWAVPFVAAARHEAASSSPASG